MNLEKRISELEIQIKEAQRIIKDLTRPQKGDFFLYYKKSETEAEVTKYYKSYQKNEATQFATENNYLIGEVLDFMYLKSGGFNLTFLSQ